MPVTFSTPDEISIALGVNSEIIFPTFDEFNPPPIINGLSIEFLILVTKSITSALFFCELHDEPSGRLMLTTETKGAISWAADRAEGLIMLDSKFSLSRKMEPIIGTVAIDCKEIRLFMSLKKSPFI